MSHFDLKSMVVNTVSTSYHHHAREAPKWKLPPQITSSRAPRLAIWNSLTKMNTPFVPLDPDGRTVTWYCCGPTVYDAGHLGLARNYISTDVIRRIMRDYFGFDVMFVQHLILKTRSSTEGAKNTCKASHPTVDQKVVDEVSTACQWYPGNVTSLEEGAPTSSLPDFIAMRRSSLHAMKTLSDDDVQLKIISHRFTLPYALSWRPKHTSHSPWIASKQFFTSIETILSTYLGETRKNESIDEHHSVLS